MFFSLMWWKSPNAARWRELTSRLLVARGVALQICSYTQVKTLANTGIFSQKKLVAPVFAGVYEFGLYHSWATHSCIGSRFEHGTDQTALLPESLFDVSRAILRNSSRRH
jgi:hypothetical protein